MYINNYFNTTIWSEQKPEFVKSLTKASNKYIIPSEKECVNGKKLELPLTTLGFLLDNNWFSIPIILFLNSCVASTCFCTVILFI